MHAASAERGRVLQVGSHSQGVARRVTDLELAQGYMNFAGVLPSHAKRLGPQEQLAPIEAEGLDKLGN